MKKSVLYSIILLLLAACTSKPKDAQNIEGLPAIFPDYVSVTIPANIAPMNFTVLEEHESMYAVVECGDIKIESGGDCTDFNIKQWRALLEASRGKSLKVTVSVKNGGQWKTYKPFEMHVSTTDLDAWGLTYRRIAPGYEMFGKMGIYQRDISTFEESAIVVNSMAPGACFNCHTSNRGSAEQYTFHVRGANGATFIHHNGEDEWLKAINDSIGGSLVYPYWHPSGQYCAYSTNTTRQVFHVQAHERLEVFDSASDVLVYNPKTLEILRDSIVCSKDHFDTYPCFSADGKTLYFSCSDAQEMPQDYEQVKYNICIIAFDPDNFCFVGDVDTIYKARDIGVSAVHLRPSFDGKWLMFTQLDYGCFPIWHNEADNYVLNLETLETTPLTAANSNKSDSWHNWANDSKWFVFTSRRDDGLYTRLYISKLDEEGNATKAFMLPQRNPKKYYDNLMYSYNTPDFAAEPVKLNKREAGKQILSNERIPTKVK